MSQPSLAGESMFDNRSLMRLLVPLLIEQFLIVFIGMVDAIMVSNIGEAAVSAVSLVDNINILMNQVFTALATGGSVIAAQYLGKNDRSNACIAAQQLYISTLAVGALVGLFVGTFHGFVLRLTFGELDPMVAGDASIYLIISAVTYPFIGVYSAGSAMYRAMGNSKVTMMVSLLLSVAKVVLNALAIYVFNLGVMGAALSTLIARAVSCALYMYLIQNPSGMIFIDSFRRMVWRPDIVKKILTIGIPTGVENGLFQLGKLLTLNLVTGLGLVSIAANAISNSVSGMFQLPGNTISLALVTVVGQLMGAGNADRAAKLTQKLVLLSIGTLAISMTALYLTADLAVSGFKLSEEAHEIAVQVLKVFAPLSIAIWSFAFVVPNTLRAAGDVRYTMVVSMISMWTLRVGLSYVLIRGFGFGLEGVWYAMYADWVGRTIFFVWRFVSGKWKTIKVI